MSVALKFDRLARSARPRRSLPDDDPGKDRLSDFGGDRARPAAAGDETERVVLLLLGEFPASAVTLALDCLNLANEISEKTLYQVTLASETGGPVTASSGIRLSVDQAVDGLEPNAHVLVSAGACMGAMAHRHTLALLRLHSRRGYSVGALGTGGSYVLAQAGLLEGRHCAVHWSHRSAFSENFPNVEVTDTLFCDDRGVLSCAGGAAVIDLILQMISHRHGPDLAAQIADAFVFASARDQRSLQLRSVAARLGSRNPALVRIVQQMQESIEDPLSSAELARRAGISTRQVERLFRRYLQSSPKQYYLELRLQRAYELLVGTEMSVAEIAMACGFANASHFSKRYEARFGYSPRAERGLPACGERASTGHCCDRRANQESTDGRATRVRRAGGAPATAALSAAFSIGL